MNTRILTAVASHPVSYTHLDVYKRQGTNTLTPGSGDLIPVEAIFRHPSYSGTQFDFDIALIKLSRAPQVPYQTVEVPDADYGDLLNRQGVTTIVTGWGLQDEAEQRVVGDLGQCLDRDVRR